MATATELNNDLHQAIKNELIELKNIIDSAIKKRTNKFAELAAEMASIQQASYDQENVVDLFRVRQERDSIHAVLNNLMYASDLLSRESIEDLVTIAASNGTVRELLRSALISAQNS